MKPLISVSKHPKVSFVVPCYKLAHLLGECLASILSQTYTDFEVLIMDDCSPDNTAEVAASFDDPRIRYIRNDPNLGHLRNYNKGIELSRGDYVWLISADDCLHRPYVLERYVQALETSPDIGFVFSSGLELRETGTVVPAKYTVLEAEDRIFDGHELLNKLLYGNCILAAAGMVRKRCYLELGAFPLDLPFAGDWYLWCHFALHYRAAYLAEPMVAYRIHEESLTHSIQGANIEVCVDDELNVLWRVMREAKAVASAAIVKKCKLAIAYSYASHIVGRRYRLQRFYMSQERCKASLVQMAATADEAAEIWPRVHASCGDIHFQNGEIAKARESYCAALGVYPWMPRVWLKMLLLGLGSAGAAFRKIVAARQLPQ